MRVDASKRYFKYIVTAIILGIVCNFVHAQKRPQQNIRRVAITTKYVVIDGNYTTETSVIKQEIFDSLGRCHTEVDWSLVDHYPHNYRWHTFDENLKVKTESFVNEKLSSVELFFYNNDSLLAKKIVKNKTLADTNQYLILYYQYDSKKNPIEITAKTPKGKIAYSSNSTFDVKGKELSRTVKVKKQFYPADSILKMSVSPTYDSIGRLASEQITITKVDRSILKKSFKYTYDKMNRLITIQNLDLNGKQIWREERTYQIAKTRLQLVKVFNSKDVLVEMYGKRYDYYPSKNRNNMEIEY
jgi:hypothetical protein